MHTCACGHRNRYQHHIVLIWVQVQLELLNMHINTNQNMKQSRNQNGEVTEDKEKLTKIKRSTCTNYMLAFLHCIRAVHGPVRHEDDPRHLPSVVVRSNKILHK